MSLLLKALQNAAKNREAAGPGQDTGSTAEGKDSGELSLEPVAEPTAARAQPGARRQAQTRSPGPADDERAAGPSPQQAQTVLRASTARARPGLFAWLAQRPLVSFSTAAGLFAIGYGVYLYLQITNPGVFTARVTPPPLPPTAAVTPPPPPPQIAAPTAPPSAGVLPGPALGPAPIAPAPTASAPLPQAAPPGGSAVAPVPAAPAPPAAAAKPAAPQAPAAPAGSTLAVPQPEAPVAAPRPRETRTAATRPAPKAAPSDGIAPATASQIVPVSAPLASAHQALEKGQLDEAERMYRQSLASDPRSIDAMLGLAATLTQQNKGDAATQLYLRALEQDPRNAHAQAGLLNISSRADPAAAETRLKQLITREPSAFLYFSLGNLYAEQGQWAGAQAAYFQAHTLAPDNPDYAFNLAVGLEHLSQPKIALDYYRRALTLAQSRGHAQFDAGKVQTRIRNLETALTARP